MAEGGFLFVDSSHPNDAASSSRNLRNARSFLMKRIRAQQASTKGFKLVGDAPARSPKIAIQKGTSTRPRPTKRRPQAGLTETQVIAGCLNERTPQGQIFTLVSANEPQSRKAPQSKSVSGTTMIPFCTTCYSLPAVLEMGECVCCKKNTAESMEIRSGILDGILDPFNSTVVPLDQKVSGLVSYFCTAVAPYITPLVYGDVPQRQWLVPSFGHSAFMHSLLSLVAVQQCIMDPQRPTDEILHHRLQAIAAVQTNLADKDSAVTDENIAAVLNLLCVEENVLVAAMVAPSGYKVRPDSTQRRVHMDGLRQMIRLRGGITKLKKLRCLQSLLIRHTGAQAVTSFDKAYLLPADLLQEMYDYPAISHFAHLETPLAAICRSHNFDSKLTDIVRVTGLMAKDKDKWKMTPEAYPNLDCFDFHNIYTIGMNNAVRWILDHPKHDPVEGLVISSCIIIFGLVCRTRSTVPGTILLVLERQRQYFSIPGVFDKIRGTGLDLWIVLITQLGAEGSTYEPLFAAELARTLGLNPQIRTLEALLRYMRQFLWCDCPLDDYTKQLWNGSNRSLLESPLEVSSIPVMAANDTKPPRTPPPFTDEDVDRHSSISFAVPLGDVCYNSSPGREGVRQALRTTLALRIRQPQKEIDRQPTAFLNPYTNGHPSLHLEIRDGTGHAYGLDGRDASQVTGQLSRFYTARPPDTLYTTLQRIKQESLGISCAQSAQRGEMGIWGPEFMGGAIAYTE